MPLDSSIVGETTEYRDAEIDARWTMAYAAALGETRACHFDTLAAGRFVAHPLFPVCFEWPVITGMRELLARSGMTPAEALGAVHTTHDLSIARPIRPPERLRTRATIAAVERHRSGAFQLTRLETVDASGAPVSSSWYGALYRGVEVRGADRRLPDAIPQPVPAPSDVGPRAELVIPIAAGLAHVYSECARIFNPIHTDAAVARAAGLPEIILHGTATLALAVSRIIGAKLGGRPTDVRRIAGRFAAMVTMPSEIVLQIGGGENLDVHFEVLDRAGRAVIRSGFVAGLYAGGEFL